MSQARRSNASIEVYPVTPERFPDVETLFGDRGACGGCWCMHWRHPAAEYEAGKGERNRKRLRKRIEEAPVPPGVLAYRDDQPVGWCSVGPRSEFVRLENSRILAPVDDEPVWCIVCFYVAPEVRRSGVSVLLIESAAQLAADEGASIVEGYPVEPRKRPMPAAFAFTGLASAFRAAGFVEVERRSATRPIMRRIPAGIR